MKIKTLLEKITYQVHQGSDELDVTDLTDDSRQARPGSLFIARDGLTHKGIEYAGAAIAQGAVAIIAQTPPPDVALATEEGQPVCWITTRLVNRTFAGVLANRFYDKPDQKLSLIGVTGTNGKTTVAYLIRHLLNAAGVRCGMIGTVEIDDGKHIQPSVVTTPGSVQFIRLLARMVTHGCKAAVAEISSHALHQGRVAGLDFEVAIFTNLTGDHMDYHHTMEQYADVKALLFESLHPDAWAILNADDPYAKRMVRDCKARKLWCTLDSNAQDHEDVLNSRLTQAQVITLSAGHSRARFDGPWGSCEADLPLVGRHNIANVLQAITAANIVSSQTRSLRPALESCPVLPGRLEPVLIGDAKDRTHLPMVLVDYAHTYDALQNVLSALRPVCQGKLIVMFGCGGDRDHPKRPIMAQVACTLADQVIVTSDNPRDEAPDDIIQMIMAGVPQDRRSIVSVEPDRAKAIVLAIQAAGPRDVVLLAGKGHEDYQIVEGVKRHFDDHEEATAVLEKRLRSSTP